MTDKALRLVEELEGLLKRATPREDGDVLSPTNQRDGWPDFTAQNGKRDDNLRLIVAAVNALPDLLSLIREQQERIRTLEGENAREGCSDRH
jgi:hypothetical protein